MKAVKYPKNDLQCFGDIGYEEKFPNCPFFLQKICVHLLGVTNNSQNFLVNVEHLANRNHTKTKEVSFMRKQLDK